MDIKFLGTGAAEGIPAINCDCDHCTRARQEGGKLVRERSAILLQLPGYNMLLEAPPDIRDLINKHRVNNLHGILVTQDTYSHIGGIKEFEWWPKPLDFLAEPTQFEVIREEHWSQRLDRLMFHIPYYPGVALSFGEFSLVPFAVRRGEACWRSPPSSPVPTGASTRRPTRRPPTRSPSASSSTPTPLWATARTTARSSSSTTPSWSQTASMT